MTFAIADICFGTPVVLYGTDVGVLKCTLLHQATRLMAVVVRRVLSTAIDHETQIQKAITTNKRFQRNYTNVSKCEYKKHLSFFHLHAGKEQAP